MATWLKHFVKLCWESITHNPVISRDLVLNLRKGRNFLLMGLVLAVGALMICLQWEAQTAGGDPIGRRLFFGMLFGQMLVVAFLMPGLVANAIIIERDRQILPSLLITPLGETRIILGKLMSSCGLMGLLLIAIFPLMGLCLTRGGVAPWELVAGCALLLYWAVAITCFALFYALGAVNTFQAVLLTHLSIVLYYFMLLPGVAFILISGVMLGGRLYQILTGTQSLFGGSPTSLSMFLTISVVTVSVFLLIIPPILFWFTKKRIASLEPRTRSKREMQHQVSFQVAQNINAPKKAPVSHWQRFSVCSNPFYARELIGMYASRSPYAIPSWYLIAMAAHLFLWAAILGLTQWLFAAALVLLAQLVPPFSAGLFAGEREKRTWELLSTTQSSQWRILTGKVQYALRQCLLRGLALYVIPVLAGSAINAMLSRKTLSEMLGMVVVATGLLAMHLIFMVTLCAYCSSRQSQLYPAYAWSYGLIAFYLFGPLFFFIRRPRLLGRICP